MTEMITWSDIGRRETVVEDTINCGRRYFAIVIIIFK